MRIGIGVVIFSITPFTEDLTSSGLSIFGIVIFVMGIIKLVNWLERE